MEEKEFDIFILPDGTIRFLYDDDLKPLLEIGQSTLSRASHVDPTINGREAVWFADLCPVSGPKLGPFPTRDAAIQAEIAWLVENHLHKLLA